MHWFVILYIDQWFSSGDPQNCSLLFVSLIETPESNLQPSSKFTIYVTFRVEIGVGSFYISVIPSDFREKLWVGLGLGVRDYTFEQDLLQDQQIPGIQEQQNHSDHMSSERKRGDNLQELTKIGPLKTGKMLPGLMSLDFCW